jgi:hypothetical protein
LFSAIELRANGKRMRERVGGDEEESVLWNQEEMGPGE